MISHLAVVHGIPLITERRTPISWAATTLHRMGYADHGVPDCILLWYACTDNLLIFSVDTNINILQDSVFSLKATSQPPDS